MRHMRYTIVRTQQIASLLMLAGLGLNGCSGAGGNAIGANVPTTLTQTLVTDAPADQVLSLGMMVDSIVLTDAAGKTVSVLVSPVPIEASHLDAVQEPLLPPLNIPQDTYVSATITVANPVVVYVDTTTKKAVTATSTLMNAATKVTFAKPITVSATSAPICFDLLVGQSVTLIPSSTTVLPAPPDVADVSPTWNITQIPLAGNPTNGGNGKVSGIIGGVVSTSATSLVIGLPNQQPFTLTTNSATVLEGFTALANLTAGELIDADYAQQSNGTNLALRIHLIAASAGDVFLGPVTAETGSPVTSFTQLVRQPLGPTAPPTATGTSYTVTVTGSTTFGTAAQMGPLPVLPFPVLFSAANMIAGQNVMVGASAVSGTNVTADSVTLVPQTVDGTVTAETVTAAYTVYTVTLPTPSALGSLTGATTVIVYAGNMTQVVGATPIVIGSTVRFNGLLFNDAGTLRMLAGASCDPPPAAPPQGPVI